jgi:chromate transport protein ChrA
VSGALAKTGSLPAVQRFLEGAGAVVPGLVAAMIYKTAAKRAWTILRIVETIALAVALIFLPAYSLPILLAAIAMLYCIEGPCKRSK